MNITTNATDWKDKNITRASTNKELIRGYKVIAYVSDPDYTGSRFREVIDCRLLMGKSNQASQVICNLWIHTPDKYLHTTGNARGYGYDKQSAAVAEALDNANIGLSSSISGVGDEAIKNALRAIAQHLGYTEIHISEAYA